MRAIINDAINTIIFFFYIDFGETYPFSSFELKLTLRENHSVTLASITNAWIRLRSPKKKMIKRLISTNMLDYNIAIERNAFFKT